MLEVERSMTDGGPLPELFGDREPVEATHFTDKFIADDDENPEDSDRFAVPSYW